MATETTEEVTQQDVIPLPGTDEEFNAEAVPVLLEVVSERLRDYVSGQMRTGEPVSLLGFALELVYQTGYNDAKARRR